MNDQEAAVWLDKIRELSARAKAGRVQLNEIDFDTRTTMLDAHQAGCTVVEIADAAGISRQVATKRLSRARGGPARPKRVRST
jgi:DNA-directed RNA polymerase specialized sigma24 family protein